MTQAQFIEKAVVEFFLQSHDFNGLPMSAILRNAADEAVARKTIAKLVRKRRISCAFASISMNPHIKRIRDLSINEQIARLKKESADSICIYPSADLVRENCDVSARI